MPDAQARQLCRLGRPARYGRGEQTLVDPRVRDTWEIPLSRVKLDKRRWNKTLMPVLDGLREDLGLPPGCELKAELRSMLVYAPGQFFVPHQDSEKDDAMVGSLVVTLPSSFKGGALVVEHRGEAATYRSAKDPFDVDTAAGTVTCPAVLWPRQRGFARPLAKEGRRHVHGIIDGTELPVRHQTRRAGSPYTLVLTKTTALMEGERHARHRDEMDLAWLQSGGAG